MYKINMKPFTVMARTKEGIYKEINYGLKESIIDILFNPELKLNSTGLLKQDQLAKKVLNCEEELLLEDEEYNRVKTAIETIRGLGKHDVEMVNRITNAEKVEVAVK